MVDWSNIIEEELKKPETAYERYLRIHLENVKLGFGWLQDNLSEVLVPGLEDGYDNIETHDASKYNTDEFEAYDAYFYGSSRSYEVLREFDTAWLKHIHRNPHHWQHWLLVNDDSNGRHKALDMPHNYIVEMVCDWWAFSWNDDNLYRIFDWYKDNKNSMVLSSKTRFAVNDILGRMHKKLISLGYENPLEG